MYRTLCLVIVTAGFAIGLRAQQQSPSAKASPGNNLLSDEVNGDLPKWLRVGAEYRTRVEGFTGGAFKPTNEDAYFLSRLRISMFLLPTDGLKLGFQGQDSHLFWKNQNPAAPPYQDSIDLRQAYVEVGDLEKRSF